VTPAFLVHADVVLAFDHAADVRAALDHVASKRRPLPAVVAVHPANANANGTASARAAFLDRRVLVSYSEGTTPAQRLVSGILFKAMGDVIEVDASVLDEATRLAEQFEALVRSGRGLYHLA
jgi:hypothetical protein